jgi:hypothetical protein
LGDGGTFESWGLMGGFVVTGDLTLKKIVVPNLFLFLSFGVPAIR